MKTRNGEAEKTWFRTDRLYTVGTTWFVATREGNDIGPFNSRVTATKSVSLYVRGVRANKNTQVHARSLSNDCWESTNYR